MAPSAGTRQSILNKLRYQAMTVAELQAALGVTRNAVMLPLSQLETTGFVRRIAMQRDGRVGKPSQKFELAPEMFEQTSPAYQAIAPHLLAVIGTPAGAQIDTAMTAVGRGIHDEVLAGAKGALGLDRATDFLQTHGAEIEIQQTGRETLVLSHSCPIGRLVRMDRHICGAIAAFLAEATGAPTVSQCEYAAKFTCRFRISSSRPVPLAQS